MLDRVGVGGARPGRQVGHHQAELLAASVELALAGWQSSDDPTERLAAFNDFSADQIAFTLTWSRPSAESFMELGWDLTRRLPMVFEALRQGRLDLPRARLFSLALALLDDQTAQAIAAKLIGDAGNATYSVLAKRLRRLIIIADPAAGSAVTSAAWLIAASAWARPTTPPPP